MTFEPQLARFVKIECLQRATQWGNSLFEVQFNEKEGGKAEAADVEATASSGAGDYDAEFAVDGKMDTRWSSNFGDSEWWQVEVRRRRA